MWKVQVTLWCFNCRSWVTCHWKCWRQCWWGHSWCCIRGTLMSPTLMTPSVESSLAGRGVLSVVHSHCCPQSAGTGIRHWPAGQNHQLVSGSVISWESWLSVSTRSFPSLFTDLHIFTRLVVTGPCTWDIVRPKWPLIPKDLLLVMLLTKGCINLQVMDFARYGIWL